MVLAFLAIESSNTFSRLLRNHFCDPAHQQGLQEYIPINAILVALPMLFPHIVGAECRRGWWYKLEAARTLSIQ